MFDDFTVWCLSFWLYDHIGSLFVFILVVTRVERIVEANIKVWIMISFDDPILLG